MKITDFMQKERYLAPEELVESGPTVFTVVRAERRLLNSDYSKNDPNGDLVIVLKEGNRAFIARGRAIDEAFAVFGPDTDDWPGKRGLFSAVFWTIRDGVNKYYIKIENADDFYHRSAHYAKKPGR